MGDEIPAGTSLEALFNESAGDLYENAPCGYISTLPGGVIGRVNQTFLTWTGYSREGLVGRRRFQDLLPTGGRIFHETHIAPLIQIQGMVNEISVEIVCADGRRLPALVNSVLKRDAEGRPLLVRTTIFNVSDRKEYERELLRERQRAEQAAKARADFVSMVSHELRTPLNAITGVVHLLERTDLSPQQQELTSLLRLSSENLLNLINDILDFNKVEAGKMRLEERSLDLRRLVAEVADTLRLKAREKRLSLSVNTDDRIPSSLLGDPVKIRQVLTNLLSNAVKFTSTGSVSVTLEVREQVSNAVSIGFCIADTGIGIAPERLPHIFDEFTQADYDIGLKYGGTGLGLAITRKLLELYCSEIDVKSELGRGSTFSFNLRLRIPSADGTATPAAGTPVDRQRLRGLKALVADDNDINVFVLTAILRRWGVEFDVVKNGRDALERVQDRDYDLLLMDLRMPKLDGYAATRAIRALPDPKYARLPIFAVSASTRMGNEYELESAGFTEFIGKPIDPDVLFTKIAWFTSRRNP